METYFVCFFFRTPVFITGNGYDDTRVKSSVPTQACLQVGKGGLDPPHMEHEVGFIPTKVRNGGRAQDVQWTSALRRPERSVEVEVRSTEQSVYH